MKLVTIGFLSSFVVAQAFADTYYTNHSCVMQTIFSEEQSELLLLDADPIKSSAELFKMTLTQKECVTRWGAGFVDCTSILESEKRPMPPYFKITIVDSQPLVVGDDEVFPASKTVTLEIGFSGLPSQTCALHKLEATPDTVFSTANAGSIGH